MGPRPTRRHLLRTAVMSAVGVAGCTAPSDRATESRSPVATRGTASVRGEPTSAPSTNETVTPVGLETLLDGLAAPVALESQPNGELLYLAEQTGRVHVLEPDGSNVQTLLDLRSTVSFGGEKGLLGMAVHPTFPEDRRLFLRYSVPPRNGTPTDYSHTFVLSEILIEESGRRADPASERTVLEIPEPQSNHNAGDLAFGSDELLYVAVGDGGGADDRGQGHAEDWYAAVEGGNGQDLTENLLGSILRLDVDAGERGEYAVPPNNPLVGKPGLDEQFAWGFRNPWRFSFDNDQLIVGDVGQNDWEEIDLVEAGGNYGWNVKEGSHCFRTETCPETTNDGTGLSDPVLEYPHAGADVSGISVIGGYVYRGSSVPELSGQYVFGDLRAEGELFVATPAGTDWSPRVLPIVDEDAKSVDRLLSFGRDGNDELYVLSRNESGQGGVHRVISTNTENRN